jgi:sulfofructose kinase
VQAVDTTGAVDVFHAALTVALAEMGDKSGDECTAITFASTAAVLKCTQRYGVMGTPSRVEVENFMLQNK